VTSRSRGPGGWGGADDAGGNGTVYRDQNGGGAILLDMSETTVGIIGAGIVGLAVARQLAQAGVTVTVFEKENAVGQHQTGHNSGVVHAGIYYAPGSAKATMTRRGVALLKEYCQDRHLPYDERGKLVVARNDTEVVKLRELERRAAANQVPGLRWLDAGQLHELEPDIAGEAALLSPSTAIVDYPAITRSYGEDVTKNGGEILLSAPVEQIHRVAGGGVSAVVRDTAYHVDHLVICAGLQADLLAARIGDSRAPEIIPFRGEYLRLRPHARDRVRRLIYPVPDPKYPFLGVHLTPRVNGESDLGPNAVLALAREGYRRRDITAAELIRLSRSGTFWKMAARNWQAGVREMRGSFFRGAFLAEARTYLPWLTSADVLPAPAGVRAQAVDPDGSLVDDFRITRAGDVTTVRNAPSPAATASLAIAEHIVARLELPA
jgi:L-2-hydroxyglutarate oxidase LhgO